MYLQRSSYKWFSIWIDIYKIKCKMYRRMILVFFLLIKLLPYGKNLYTYIGAFVSSALNTVF